MKTTAGEWPARRRPRAGFTLVEVLIAGVAVGLVSLAALGLYRGQHSQYIQQNHVVDMQQNLRVVMSELTRQVRQAGYLAEGFVPVQILGSNRDMLLVRFHDGDSVRAQIYFLLSDSTGQKHLMTQLNGEPARVFAEGIDSLKFNAGGTGGVDWVTVELVARSQNEGFQTHTPRGASSPHLYRRLASTIKLRNG